MAGKLKANGDSVNDCMAGKLKANGDSVNDCMAGKLKANGDSVNVWDEQSIEGSSSLPLF